MTRRSSLPSPAAATRHASRQVQASLQLARRGHELLWAAPQVATHRLTRLAQAGPRPALTDLLEFQRMGTEKVAAFWESWQAMGLQALRAWHTPWWQAGLAWTTLAARGLAPVHRRAVANARRLGTAPRR